MLQDDDNTNWELSEIEMTDPGESTLSSDMEEDDLDNQSGILHLNWAHHDQTI
jgi:hypothetical protein